ncbi:MAG: O-antigen ligase family protein [Patescibacteria group bacterium]
MPQNYKKVIQKLLYLFVFLLPWQMMWIFDEQFINGRKWQYGTGVIYITELILWLAAIICFFGIIKYHGLSGIKQKIVARSHNFKWNVKTVFIFSVWLLMVWSLISISWSGNHGVAFYVWFHLLEGILFLSLCLLTQAKIRKISWAVVGAGLIQAVLAIWQFANQEVVANKFFGLASHRPELAMDIVVENFFGRWLRAYGGLAHPNILGGFLVGVMLIILFLYFTGGRQTINDWLKRIFLAVSLVIVEIGLFFSFSRSAWLSAIIGLIAFVLFLILNKSVDTNWPIKKDRKFFYDLTRIIFYLVFTGIILLFIYQPLLSSRVASGGRLEQRSNEERILYTQQAGQIISSHWLLGTGLGNYTYELSQSYPQNNGWELQPVHNIFILILSELGLVGLLAFLGVLATSMVLAIKRNRLFLGLALMLVIVGFFDHYLWTQYFGLIWWWLVLVYLTNSDSHNFS